MLIQTQNLGFGISQLHIGANGMNGSAKCLLSTSAAKKLQEDQFYTVKKAIVTQHCSQISDLESKYNTEQTIHLSQYSYWFSFATGLLLFGMAYFFRQRFLRKTNLM